MAHSIGMQDGRILRLPNRGSLLVCTDIHGNLRDFSMMAALFERHSAAGKDPFLLFTGDLIHGPAPDDEQRWPSGLGRYYPDQSAEVLERFLELEAGYPGRVACLLGNHEHSHVGGPHTPKFWVDETEHFELSVGIEQAGLYCRAMARFPLVALAPCGVAILHAAPNWKDPDLQQLDSLGYGGYENSWIHSVADSAPLLRLLWSRGCSSEVAEGFLSRLGEVGWPLYLAIYGHDVVAEGFDRVDDRQLQLSTSFGVRDECKYYVELDLASVYQGSHQLAVGSEIKQLYAE